MKLSCCIPTLNRSKSLARAVRSLCNQILQPGSFEILIIDNGSSDNTKTEAEGVMREMSLHRIRYFLEPEPGLLSGRHRGALESDGEILIFLDDDIEAIPGYLQAILDAFQDPAVQLVGGPNLPNYRICATSMDRELLEHNTPWRPDVRVLEFARLGRKCD